MLWNAKILLATKHKKELVIEPAIKSHLEAEICVADGFDTDQYGTFDGVIKRVDGPRETVVKKAQDASIKYGFPYAIASEGSFGPHPAMPFIAGDVEHLVLYDAELDVSICETIVSGATNYSHLDIKDGDDISTYLKRVNFGSHALNIRALKDDILLAKGIKDIDILQSSLKREFKYHHELRLETDMRAMNNPMRMQVIQSVAVRLAKRLATHCPSCNCYGYGEMKLTGSLPCSVCGGESTIHSNREITCIFCSFKSNLHRDDGMQSADPKYCLLCNP